MSNLPERDGRNEGPEPLWAVEAPETTWEEPTPMPQARAWFSVTERRLGLPARIASRAAGLVAVGALMTTGVAIAAFADDGSSTDKPACSASVTTDCVDKKADDTPSTQEAKADDPPAASTEDKPAKTQDAPAANDGGGSGGSNSDASSTSADTSAADSSKSTDTSGTDTSKDSGSKGSGASGSGSNDSGTKDSGTTTGSSGDGANATTTNDGGTSTAGSNDTSGTGPASTDQGSASSGSGSSGSGSSGGNGSGGSDDPTTHDAGGNPASGGTDDTPTTTVPVTNPLPPAPAATSPASTTPPPATDDVSALAGLEVTADATYFQLPSGGNHATGSSTVGSGGKGVTGGLTDSGGANDIHAVGISALALLQLQRASSLAPPPAPLPNIRELTPAQLTKLRQTAHRTGVAWTVLAAVQRLGHKGRTLAATARFLRTHGARGGADSPFRAQNALTALYGSKDKGEHAAALAAYYWAVGSTGLTKGLAVASPSLGDALLRSPAVSVYAAGRSDLALHRVDPRVEMAIRYLQASFGTVSVTCLISGHSVFTSSGNVSAHIFGRAADISAVGGTPILGHQGPQTVTERAVRLLLMLPKDVAPRQIISLMDLDGATGNTGSFALPDHANHIHIGY